MKGINFMQEEAKYVSPYKTQKISKPKPEDIAGDFLDTEKTAAMLNLVEFIRVNKISIQWASGNS
jgi:DNA transposition AAA+ family ATPase